MKLITVPTSGNGYKVELFLNLLNLEFERQYIKLNLTTNSHKTPEFLALNPRGQVPVLEDNGLVLWESQSILVYLAKKYADESWFPTDPISLSETIRWLAFSGMEVDDLAYARRIRLFNWDEDLTPHQQKGIAGLEIMDAHLERNDFLVGDKPTIADIACYPYIGMAHEGEVDLAPFTNVNSWIERLKNLTGYIDLPKKKK